MEEYYRILGLSQGAAIADVKKAYRLLARKYHPDVNPSQEAKRRFQQIAEAYAKLLAHHQASLAQAYSQASTRYQAHFQQYYQTPPSSAYQRPFQSSNPVSDTPPPLSDEAELSLTHRVVYVLLDVLSWSVSLFFISLPVLAGYLMAEKGFGWWEGAIMTPLSLAGMLVIWRTIRFRRNAF